MPKKGKDVLAIMLGGKSPKSKGRHEEEDEYEEEEDGYGEAFEESAKAAFEAANEGDEEGFVSALKDAIVTCLEDHEDEE
tara:strand:- start:518 stop:757 length:240 start_codon:yes stop_codon:yes gene_type:complete